ncbi:hypothetical protein cypCar_00039832, partial [Cyprinus carpio]
LPKRGGPRASFGKRKCNVIQSWIVSISRLQHHLQITRASGDSCRTAFGLNLVKQKQVDKLFSGIMNSLSGKSVLALCRVFSSPLSLPAAMVGAVRVCHSGVNSKGTVFTKKRGYDITRNPHLNKGMAFTLEERLQLGIHGLLPPCFLSQDVQVLRVMKSYETRSNPLDKYILLMTLQDRNEKLFYRVLTSDIEEFMPIVYTPTVGLACQQYGLAFRRPRGLFITIHDKGHIATMLNSWPEENIKVSLDHLSLFVTLFPILFVFVQALLDDPLYIGLKHKRVRGKEYDDLIDEFMQAVTDKYGMNCLIQFEDFANCNAFRILNNYRNHYCTFNDDIQGTASVAVAGVLAALKITKNKLSDHKFVFQGAGEAALGIAHLLIMAMAKEGVPHAEAVKRIWMVDSKGLIVKGRGIFASGSPFKKVTLADGRTFYPGQGNNAYVFPGVALGVIACGVRHISDDVFLTTAEAISDMVTEEHLAEGRLYPPLNTIREVSFKIAVKIVDHAYKQGIASWYPEPKDKEAFILSQVYNSDYDSFTLDSYSWPKDAMTVQNV